jgi:chaperonin GroES
MNFRPLADRIVVRRVEEMAQTKGGIFIPEVAKEKPQEGEILAVGAGAYENGNLVPMTLNVGDKVLFGKWAGTEITVDGEKVMIMQEKDVLGIITKPVEAV